MNLHCLSEVRGDRECVGRLVQRARCVIKRRVLGEIDAAAWRKIVEDLL